MRLYSFVSAVAAICSVAVDAELLEKRAFSIPHRRQVDDEPTFDGFTAVRKAYLKHGLDLPDNFRHAKRKVKRQGPPANTRTAFIAQATASVEAFTEANDLEYLSPINVGGHTLRLDFDTGSSDLWVFSDHLPAKQQQGHSLYGASQKNDQVKQGFSWKIAYGDGSGASGMVYADRVQVGDATATTQAVEAATSISSEFVDEHSDGLLGLGFGTTNTIRPEKQKTFFENIKDGLKLPLFTVVLKKNATGSYDFGYIDPAKYIGQLQYAPVNTSRGYWEYTLTGYSIGSDANVSPVSYQSIADTGTTLMLLPKSIVDTYYKRVPTAKNVASEGGYVFQCGTQLPDLTVKIGSAAGQHASCTIPGHFFDRGLSDTGSGNCYGGLQVGQDKLSIWGDVFLKSQFAVFDGSNPPRIGFAPQATSYGSRVVQQNEAVMQVPATSAPAVIVQTPSPVPTPVAPTVPAVHSQLPTVTVPTAAKGQASPTPSTAAGLESLTTPSYIRFLVNFLKNWFSKPDARKRIWAGAVPHGRGVRL